MKRTVALFAVTGAVWMLLVIFMGWHSAAVATNYPGMFAARFVRSKGIAPSSTTIQLFYAWLVVTSAIEWGICAVLIRHMWGHFRLQRR